MPRFTVRPTNPPRPSAELISCDAASALHLVDRLHCDEADVLREGAYSFSVSRSEGGCWLIFDRHGLDTPTASTELSGKAVSDDAT